MFNIFKNYRRFGMACLLVVAATLLASCGTQPKTEPAKTTPAKAEQVARKTIVFFGNSLTAAYGLDLSEGFPALIQSRLDSLQMPYKAVNAGVSGETSASGNTRVDWILKQPVDVFVLELGGNDGLRGIPLTETVKNLQSIIDKVKAHNANIKIVLAGLQIPPNMGPDYINEFKTIYPKLAEANRLPLIPFLLEGVGGIEALNLPDGIHPTAEGQKIVADNVWKVLKDVL